MGLLRAVTPWTEWIAGWGFDLSKGEPDLSADHVRQRILTLIGDDSVALDIEGASAWYVNEAYAPRYSAGRVFCAGDAVHRHPPSSGLGMNTCVQDAYNLGWKLAYVAKGVAGPGLLESYTLERAPVGKQIVQRANQSRRDYAVVNACFRVADAENPVAAGVARLQDPGPDGVAARTAIAKALDLKNTEFNAQGVEMNQRYESGAVIPDEDASAERFARDPELYVQSTTRPGAKIPHAWLVDRRGRRISTLDIVGRQKFTLITGLAGAEWLDAARTLDRPFLRSVMIGTPGAQDLYCEWRRMCEIEEGGALLVRPDGYVAWRHHGPAIDRSTAIAELGRALDTILDLPTAMQPHGAGCSGALQAERLAG